MGQLKQISDNSFTNGSKGALPGYQRGVSGLTLLSNGDMFLLGEDGRYHFVSLNGQKSDGQSQASLDLKNVVYGEELPDGGLICWSNACVYLISPDRQLTKTITVSDKVQHVKILSNGNFIPVGGDKNEPTLYGADGSPIQKLSWEKINTDVGSVGELYHGRFMTMHDCFALNLIWNADGSLYRQFNEHALEIYYTSRISGNRFVTVGADNKSHVYDHNADYLFELEAPEAVILNFHELPDRRLVLQLEDEDGNLLWIYFDENGRRLKSLKTERLSLLPKLILQNGLNLSLDTFYSNKAWIWNDDGEILARLEHPTGWMLGAIQLKNGNIVTWAKDNTIRLWGQDGTSLGALEGPNSEIESVHELPDGRLLSSGKYGGVMFWDTAQAGTAREAHKNNITGILQLENSDLVTWSRAEKRIRIWDKTGQPIRSEKGGIGISRLEDGGYISWGANTENQIWSSEFEFLREIEGYAGEQKFEFHTTENILQLSNSWIVSTVRSNCRVSDLSGAQMGAFQAFRYGPTALTELSDGRIISTAENVHLIHEADGTFISQIEASSMPHLLKDGRVLFCDNGLQYFNTSGELLKRVPLPGRSSLSGLLTDERLVSFQNAELCLLSVDGALLSRAPADGDYWFKELTNGRFLTWSRVGPDINLRRADGQIIATLRGLDGNPQNVLEIADGNILASGRKSLCLWDENGGALAKADYEHQIQSVLPLKSSNDIAVCAGNELYILRYEAGTPSDTETPIKKPTLLGRLFNLGY